MKKKINYYVNEIQNKSEKTKLKIIWFLSVFCVIIIIGVWFFAFSINKEGINKISNFQFPNMPDFQEKFDNMDIVADQFKIITDSLYTEEEKNKIEQIVKKYLNENNLLTEENFENLRLQGIKKRDDGWIVKYVQYYNDVAVNESENIFIVDIENEEVTKVSLNFYSNVSINSKPNITDKEAFEIVLKELEDESLEIKNLQLVIYRYQKFDLIKDYLAWKVEAFSVNFDKDYYYFIDAHNGNIISYHT